MKMQRHPNYYQKLLLAGAKVLKPINMRAGGEKGAGRAWSAAAKLQLGAFEICLSASFHGNKVETTVTAEANMNISGIRMPVEGGSSKDYIDFSRNSHKMLILEDGVYVCPDHTESTAEAMRKLGFSYNTSQYIGILDEREHQTLLILGYKKVISFDAGGITTIKLPIVEIGCELGKK